VVILVIVHLRIHVAVAVHSRLFMCRIAAKADTDVPGP